MIEVCEYSVQKPWGCVWNPAQFTSQIPPVCTLGEPPAVLVLRYGAAVLRDSEPIADAGVCAEAMIDVDTGPPPFRWAHGGQLLRPGNSGQGCI